MQTATPEDDDPFSAMDSVSGPSGLSTLQRDWARQFVLLGGNATKAAVIAGYAESSAHLSGRKNCLNGRVMSYVRQLSMADCRQYLPLAISTLVACCADAEADWKDRIKAAEKLCVFGGLAPKESGPSVSLSLTINGSEARQEIAKVHEARQARLARMSSIGDAMSDRLDGLDTVDEGHLIEAQPTSRTELATAAPAARGGDQAPGSPSRHVPIPPHGTEKI